MNLLSLVFFFLLSILHCDTNIIFMKTIISIIIYKVFLFNFIFFAEFMHISWNWLFPSKRKYFHSIWNICKPAIAHQIQTSANQLKCVKGTVRSSGLNSKSHWKTPCYFYKINRLHYFCTQNKEEKKKKRNKKQIECVFFYEIHIKMAKSSNRI